jgi:hypothetical protein
MKKKIKWVIAGVVAGLLVIAIAIPVLANGPDGVSDSTVQGCGYGNCQGLGFETDEEVATLLGLTPEQIREQKLSGKSLVQIAADQNVDEQALVSAILAEKQTNLKSRVAAGKLTQEQADLMLAQMKERVQLAVKRTKVGPPKWAGGKSDDQSGQGMMRKGGQRGNQADCTGIGQMMRSGRNAR